MAGAQFNVTDPDAGTLVAVDDVVCFTTGTVEVAATPNGGLLVPDGYVVRYVLTQGSDLVIRQLGTSPSFLVSESGNYTIHTFVFPADLDLSAVVPGVTTGGDVLALLAANNICASLDVAGAPVVAEECAPVCTASAGTISAITSSVCLVDGAATISASPNGDAIVPAGYQTIHVLTQGPGLVIVNAGPVPSFDVTALGDYTLHTLVYDPATLDPGIVELGVTTGFDVNSLLIQGGGTICAGLDVTGAPVSVIECNDECSADAGNIVAADFIVCRQGGSATLVGVPAGNAIVPAGYQTLYVLTRGFGLTIRQVSTTPQFTVEQLGFYTIHTLVYDPATLDLGIVVPGQTTGFDVNALLIQGGGSICASLDVQGAPQIVLGPILCSILGGFNNGIAPQNVDELNNALSAAGLNGSSDEMVMSTIENDAPVSVLNVFPNPTRDQLTLDLSVLTSTDLELSIINGLGQEVFPGTSLNVGQGANRRSIDVSKLPSGAYLIRLTMADKVLTHRFTKVD